MKVLMTSDTVGGVWSYAMQLTRSLAPHGVEVALVTMGAPLSPDQQAEVESLENLQVFPSSFRLEWMEDPWEDVAAAGRWLLEIAEACRPDLVHLNNFAHGTLPFQAPVLMVGHSCVCSWFEAVRGHLPDASWERYQAAVKHGLRAADLVVAPTAAMLSCLDRFYGPLPRMEVIRNGRDAEDYQAAAKEPFIFSAGRLWDEAKNVQALLNIAPQLDWPVKVAGLPHPDGHQRSLDGVQLLGRLTPRQMAQVYARAAIYALPARYEPFGLTVLEAALSGCVLVLGDIPSLRELWHGAAWLVPPDDNRQLAEALNQLARDERLRQDYREKARRRAATLTARMMASRYLEAYEKLKRHSPSVRHPRNNVEVA